MAWVKRNVWPVTVWPAEHDEEGEPLDWGSPSETFYAKTREEAEQMKAKFLAGKDEYYGKYIDECDIGDEMVEQEFWEEDRPVLKQVEELTTRIMLADPETSAGQAAYIIATVRLKRMAEQAQEQAEPALADILRLASESPDLDTLKERLTQVTGHETIEKQRLFVDMDGTLAEFRTVDTLEVLYEEGYFYNLEPQMTVVDAIRDIVSQSEVEVYVMSSVLSDSSYALAEKNAWLDKYLPEIDREHRIFPPCGDNKLSYIPGEVRPTDCLLDDYTKNLVLWEPPAKGIKLLNGINDTHHTWKGTRVDYRESVRDLSRSIMDIMRKTYEQHNPDLQQDRQQTMATGTPIRPIKFRQPRL